MGKWSAATRRKFQATIKNRQRELGKKRAQHKGYGGGPKTTPMFHSGGGLTAAHFDASSGNRKGKEPVAALLGVGKFDPQDATTRNIRRLVEGLNLSELAAARQDTIELLRLQDALRNLLDLLT